MSKQNQHLCRGMLVSALALFAFLFLMYAVALSFDAGAEIGAWNSDSSFTPAPGNPVRKAVLDSLRQEVKEMHGLEVVFVVRHLKVKDGWAWVHVEPQSPDGANRYEDVSALLTIRRGTWTIAEIPCTEVDNPGCLDTSGYFAGLKKRFPDCPGELLPTRPERTKTDLPESN